MWWIFIGWFGFNLFIAYLGYLHFAKTDLMYKFYHRYSRFFMFTCYGDEVAQKRAMRGLGIVAPVGIGLMQVILIWWCLLLQRS